VVQLQGVNPVQRK